MKRKLSFGFIPITAICLVSLGIAASVSYAEESWYENLDCAECHEVVVATFETPETISADDSDLETQKGKEDPAETTETRTGSEEAKNDTLLEEGAYLAAEHTSVECIFCHNDEETLASRHEGATKEGTEKLKRLKKTSVSDETCLSCHGSWEELAEATEDCTILTDEEGTVVNPHATPHIGDPTKLVTCVTCHNMHTTTSVESISPKLCNGCHHEKIYECRTCHD